MRLLHEIDEEITFSRPFEQQQSAQDITAQFIKFKNEKTKTIERHRNCEIENNGK